MIGWALVQRAGSQETWVAITFGLRVLSEADNYNPIGRLQQLAVIEEYSNN